MAGDAVKGSVRAIEGRTGVVGVVGVPVVGAGVIVEVEAGVAVEEGGVVAMILCGKRRQKVMVSGSMGLRRVSMVLGLTVDWTWQ